MPTASSSLLLGALRAGTRDLHDRTEAAFVLGSDAITRDAYARVLARLTPFHAAAELALAPWASALAPLGVDLAERRRAHLLRRDLAVLGVQPADDAATIPSVDTLAGALGLLYVLEGATLGGQLLRRRLAAMLALTTERGLSFLDAYGAAVGPMWRGFLAALAAYESTLAPADHAVACVDAVAAARGAFLAFERDVVRPTATLLRPPHPAALASAAP